MLLLRFSAEIFAKNRQKQSVPAANIVSGKQAEPFLSAFPGQNSGSESGAIEGNRDIDCALPFANMQNSRKTGKIGAIIPFLRISAPNRRKPHAAIAGVWPKWQDRSRNRAFAGALNRISNAGAWGIVAKSTGESQSASPDKGISIAFDIVPRG